MTDHGKDPEKPRGDQASVSGVDENGDIDPYDFDGPDPDAMSQEDYDALLAEDVAFREEFGSEITPSTGDATISEADQPSAPTSEPGGSVSKP